MAIPIWLWEGSVGQLNFQSRFQSNLFTVYQRSNPHMWVTRKGTKVACLLPKCRSQREAGKTFSVDLSVTSHLIYVSTRVSSWSISTCIPPATPMIPPVLPWLMTSRILIVNPCLVWPVLMTIFESRGIGVSLLVLCMELINWLHLSPRWPFTTRAYCHYILFLMVSQSSRVSIWSMIDIKDKNGASFEVECSVLLPYSPHVFLTLGTHLYLVSLNLYDFHSTTF